jgi:hypothetical protein
MSLRIDTTEWISGALLIGETGGGVIAQNLAVTGDNGTGYLYDDVALPADNGKEICGRITTWPVGLTLYAYEDGSVIASAVDGIYTAQYQLYVDYVATGSPVNLTFTFGVAGVTVAAAWVEGSETVSVAITAAPLGVSLDAAWTEVSEGQSISLNAALSTLLAAAWVEGSETNQLAIALETFFVNAPPGSGYHRRFINTQRPTQ